MWKNFKKKLREGIASILENTHNHYLCYLPGRISFLSFVTLKLFFSGIKIGDDQVATLEKIQKEGIVVFTTKHKSYFDFLFSYTRYKQKHLPFPEIGFDYRFILWQPVRRILKIILAHLDHFYHHLTFPNPYQSGYIKEELLKGQSGLLALVEKKGFYRRFVKSAIDPVKYLIEMQKSIDRPILLVPQLMFFSKKPLRSVPSLLDLLFGSEGNPGKIRGLIALFKNPGNVFVEISDPVNLKQFIELAENKDRTVEHLALILRRNLLVQLNRHRQSITGPVLKSRQELKENILTNERLQNFLDQYSKKHNIPIQQVRKNADDCLEEIAANYSAALINIAAAIVGWITRVMFEGVTVNNEELGRVKAMYQKGPIVFLPCHKSHIDYLILSYILYTNNMPSPHVAAGKNLSFWPMGPLFRNLGAFFIRRTFKGAVLYSKVFAEYIEKLLEERFNIELFIEGGRSRTGKLIMPKLGLLSILLNAYKNGVCEDMIFVPIYIGYDRVLEENSYLIEIEGGQKEPENFLQVIKARKFLRKRYGKIYVRFHEPISLKDLLSQNSSPIQEMTPKDQNALCRNLGFRVINAINRVTVVTPHALVASAILNSSQKRISRHHLMLHVQTYMNYLNLQGALLADTLRHDSVHAVERVLDDYVQRKLIDRISTDKDDPSSEKYFMVNESKRPILEYYKNNCISFFIPAAFTALSIFEIDSFQFSASDLHANYSFLQNFFKFEFAYDIDRTPEFCVRKSIKAFIDDAILMPHPTLPDTYNVTSSGFRKLKFFTSFVKTYFESYWIVLNYFMRHSQNSTDAKERLKKIQATGNRLYKNREIELKEALSKINYNNAMAFFTTHGVKGPEDKEKIEFYAHGIQKHLNHWS